MENTVTTNNDAMEVAIRDQAAVDERPSAAELLGVQNLQEEQTETVEEELGEVDEPVKEEPEVDAPKADDPQDKVGQAFAKQRRALEQKFRREYENRDEFRLGQAVISNLMTGGMSKEEAFNTALSNVITGIAQTENVHPYVARQILLDRQRGQQPQHQDPVGYGQELRRQIEAMDLPEGFDLNMAAEDLEFVESLTQMPVEKAVKLYHLERTRAQLEEQANMAKELAKKELAEQIASRKVAPMPMKPAQSMTPVVDYSSLSDEEILERRSLRKQNRL